VRAIVFAVGGELVGGAAGVVLLHVLALNDMIGRGKGLEGIFDYLVGLIIFPLVALILGSIGGLLVAQLVGPQQRNSGTDHQLLLKQLLTSSGGSTIWVNPPNSS